MAYSINHADYASMFGPTVGDRVRLADTELVIEVERDHTIYGEEVKFGGGKVIRDGMGQSQVTRAGGAVDTPPRGRRRASRCLWAGPIVAAPCAAWGPWKPQPGQPATPEKQSSAES